MEHLQPSFDTVTEALNWLNRQGFTADLNLSDDCVLFNNGEQTLSLNEIIIEYFFRFEGDTDPGDENILYAITSDEYNIKGVLRNAFGMYTDTISNEMIRKLTVRY